MPQPQQWLNRPQRMVQPLSGKDLQGEGQIKKEHIDNNRAVRKILQERGVLPESLPVVEDVKKVERSFNADNKKASC